MWTDIWTVLIFLLFHHFFHQRSKNGFIPCCCCNSTSVWLCWSFLSWSSSSLRELSNFAFPLRNSTASLLLFLLLLFLFFFFTSTSPSAPHLFSTFSLTFHGLFQNLFCSLFSPSSSAVSTWPPEDLKFWVFHSIEIYSNGVPNLTSFRCPLSILENLTNRHFI